MGPRSPTDNGVPCSRFNTSWSVYPMAVPRYALNFFQKPCERYGEQWTLQWRTRLTVGATWYFVWSADMGFGLAALAAFLRRAVGRAMVGGGGGRWSEARLAATSHVAATARQQITAPPSQPPHPAPAGICPCGMSYVTPTHGVVFLVPPPRSDRRRRTNQFLSSGYNRFSIRPPLAIPPSTGTPWQT